LASLYYHTIIIALMQRILNNDAIPRSKNKLNHACSIHPDLLLAQKLVYEPCGLIRQNITKEAESEDYGAFRFELKNRQIMFRTGKITPQKLGNLLL